MSVVAGNKKNFEDEVIGAKQPVLVDFWAAWCGPCQAMLPVVHEIGEEAGDKAKVVTINVDEERELAKQFTVMSIPTLMVFKDGKPVSRMVGVQSKQKIVDELGI